MELREGGGLEWSPAQLYRIASPRVSAELHGTRETSRLRWGDEKRRKTLTERWSRIRGVGRHGPSLYGDLVLFYGSDGTAAEPAADAGLSGADDATGDRASWSVSANGAFKIMDRIVLGVGPGLQQFLGEGRASTWGRTWQSGWLVQSEWYEWGYAERLVWGAPEGRSRMIRERTLHGRYDAAPGAAQGLVYGLAWTSRPWPIPDAAVGTPATWLASLAWKDDGAPRFEVRYGLRPRTTPLSPQETAPRRESWELRYLQDVAPGWMLTLQGRWARSRGRLGSQRIAGVEGGAGAAEVEQEATAFGLGLSAPL